jgi:hypothetical protein
MLSELAGALSGSVWLDLSPAKLAAKIAVKGYDIAKVVHMVLIKYLNT